eukprot:gb/GFBE01067294.1/.p1 GENE.gb/GFBE01067294.1/~~gb/GFBE01067294.1/.p1  ORF type:complete len:185 (+),score=40.20 gb/GFBE01067294.1/:1-555(+)
MRYLYRIVAAVILALWFEGWGERLDENVIDGEEEVGDALAGTSEEATVASLKQLLLTYQNKIKSAQKAIFGAKAVEEDDRHLDLNATCNASFLERAITEHELYLEQLTGDAGADVLDSKVVQLNKTRKKPKTPCQLNTEVAYMYCDRNEGTGKKSGCRGGCDDGAICVCSAEGNVVFPTCLCSS